MTLPDRADVVVVGGGFAGAATAYELARAGVRDVVVLERERVLGYHASGRNAALGRQIVEDDAVTDLTVRGAAFVRDPPPGFSEAPLARRVGSVLLADTGEAIADLCRRAAARGVAHERVGTDEAARRVPVLRGVRAAGGVWFPGDVVIDVHALLSGYVAGARRLGARVELGREALRFRARSGGVEVATADGSVSARCAVAAAGAWAGPVGVNAGAIDPGLVPIHRHLFVTEPVPDLDRSAPFVWHIGADGFYVRPEGEGLLVSGCDESRSAPADATASPTAVTDLAEKMSRVAPGVAELGIARRWACLRTFAADRRPIVGWDPDVDWLFWVAGLGGHGATASRAIGEDAAAGILARL